MNKSIDITQQTAIGLSFTKVELSFTNIFHDYYGFNTYKIFKNII